MYCKWYVFVTHQFAVPKLILWVNANLIRERKFFPKPIQRNTRNNDFTITTVPTIMWSSLQCVSCISSSFSLLPFVKGRRKGRARIKHPRYRKDFFKTVSIEEGRCRYRKIPWCCTDPAEAVPTAKIAWIAKWSSIHHHDGIWHQFLWQSFGEVWSNVFWTFAFLISQEWLSSSSTPPRLKERSSAQGLPWASVSMDTHQGIAECVATCFWSYLY